jgi:16S rRNA (guanine1207-N2)-methyltransferase
MRGYRPHERAKRAQQHTPDGAPVSGAQYFAPRPAVSSNRREVSLLLPERALRIVTDRGVFGYGEVDAGTRYLLLEAPAVPAAGDLLDLGCGTGAIACAMAARSPGATVWAVDVNERALACCAASAEANGLANVRPCLPHDVPPEVRFAAIRSNPPIRVGKAALHDLLTTWLARLATGGSAVLVVHRHLGSDSLTTWLDGQGWRCDRLGSRQGYRLLQVQPAVTAP